MDAITVATSFLPHSHPSGCRHPLLPARHDTTSRVVGRTLTSKTRNTAAPGQHCSGSIACALTQERVNTASHTTLAAPVSTLPNLPLTGLGQYTHQHNTNSATLLWQHGLCVHVPAVAVPAQHRTQGSTHAHNRVCGNSSNAKSRRLLWQRGLCVDVPVCCRHGTTQQSA
jgi:hypothetical protein